MPEYESTIDEYPKLDKLIDGKALRVEDRLEGQNVEERCVILGMRAGPEMSVDNVCHELAHFIEIDEGRMATLNWGLNYGTEIPGFATREFQTGDHIWREIRVWAIQWHLQQFIGKPRTFDELGKIGFWLPDRWTAFPDDVDWSKRDESNRWFAEQIKREADKRDIDSILTELERRRSILLTT